MFSRCAVLCILICLSFVESKKSYTYSLSNSSWNNEVRKCGSSGMDDHTYTFEIGDLKKFCLDYSDIDALTTVIAYGLFSGSTKATSMEVQFLLLNEYEEGTGYKAFTGRWKYAAMYLWATQRCETIQTVNITSGGDVRLISYVMSSSVGAISCAGIKAYVNKVQIIN